MSNLLKTLFIIFMIIQIFSLNKQIPQTLTGPDAITSINEILEVKGYNYDNIGRDYVEDEYSLYITAIYDDGSKKVTYLAQNIEAHFMIDKENIITDAVLKKGKTFLNKEFDEEEINKKRDRKAEIKKLHHNLILLNL